MRRNLKAEMVRKNVTTKDIAAFLEISERTARNKISGTTDFAWTEACKMHLHFFPEVDKDYLLSTQDTA